MTSNATAANTGYTGQIVFTAPTEVISANAQVQVLAQIQKLADALNGEPMGLRMFGEMNPTLRNWLQVEIANLKTAIDAAPAT